MRLISQFDLLTPAQSSEKFDVLIGFNLNILSDALKLVASDFLHSEVILAEKTLAASLVAFLCQSILNS